MMGADIAKESQRFQPCSQHGFIEAKFCRDRFTMIQVQVTEQAGQLASGHCFKHGPRWRQRRCVICTIVVLDRSIPFVTEAQYLLQ